ncbi:MAG TPA: hypothetical protein VMB80_00545 [Candidatus Acidoferrum sp.]|nr:hypothetical protein [Candidatus Acidoferrum sp.]
MAAGAAPKAAGRRLWTARLSTGGNRSKMNEGRTNQMKQKIGFPDDRGRMPVLNEIS